MLSSEGNAGERWKTTIGLITKKQLCTCSTPFFVHFFAIVSHDYNVKLPETSSYTFYRGNVVRFLVPFFFHCRSCWPLAFLILSPPLQNFHFDLPTIKCLLCFFSLAVNRCRPFCRWASLAYRLLSLFLCVSLALFSKFVDMSINLSLIL